MVLPAEPGSSSLACFLKARKGRLESAIAEKIEKIGEHVMVGDFLVSAGCGGLISEDRYNKLCCLRCSAARRFKRLRRLEDAIGALGRGEDTGPVPSTEEDVSDSEFEGGTDYTSGLVSLGGVSVHSAWVGLDGQLMSEADVEELRSKAAERQGAAVE